MPDHIGTDLSQTLNAYHDAVRAGLEERGFSNVTLAEADVIELVAEQGAMGDIAKRRDVSKQAIQGQVQSLAKRGYVALMPDPNDARAKQVVLTDRGADLVAAAVEVKRALHLAVEDKLGTERLKNMRNILSQTRAAVGLPDAD